MDSSAPLSEPLAAQLKELANTSIQSVTPVAGGCINDACVVVFGDGRRAFVKTHAKAPSAMFEAEARGLGWLAEAQKAGGLRVPRVLWVGSNPDFLALEYLPAAQSTSQTPEALGQGLAAVHQFGAPGFGLDHSNFIGDLPQDNTPTSDWAGFYRRHRLEPQLRLASEQGLVSPAMRAGFRRLLDRLEEWVGPPEPPARLHGDLWSGNVHVTEGGQPCLVDPAAYGGHREMDLAMLQLFGGVSNSCIDAYNEAFPLADGWQERVALCQLYPLLVHVNLFGASYVRSVERALGRYIN